jgi:predicted transcriptional regulator
VKSASATQNLTVSLPKEIVRRVKVVAAQKGTSVSRMLTDALEQIVAHDDVYERARQRHLALLKRPINLGTRGRATWSRDDLHHR